MAAWIAGPVSERCPNAVLCIDAFLTLSGLWNLDVQSGALLDDLIEAAEGET
jgi:hypothetical protein